MSDLTQRLPLREARVPDKRTTVWLYGAFIVGGISDAIARDSVPCALDRARKTVRERYDRGEFDHLNNTPP